MKVRHLMYGAVLSLLMSGAYSHVAVAADSGGGSTQLVLACNTDGTYTCGNTCGQFECDHGWCCSSDGC